MTGGEDAEKGKDSEVAEDTGSPDRRDPISSRSHQESPLFKYLCDLSPIKPAKAVHVAQTYNELTFPPEPRIFASPRSSQRSSSDALKRVLVMERFATAETQADGHGSLGGPWLEKANCTNNPRSNITTVSSGYLPSPCNKVLKHGDQAGPSSTRRAEALEEVKSKSCKVESVGDDLHLSENAPHRTQFCAMKTSEMDQKLPTCQLSGTSTSSDSFKSQFANIQEVVKASPLGGPYNSEKVSERYEDHRARLRLYKEQAEASDTGKSSQGFAPEIVGSVPVVISDHVSESQDRGLKRALVSPSHNEEQTQLGQDTTDMAYFLGGDQDSEQRNREDDWSEDSSEGSRLSVHTTSECLKSQKGDMCEGITMNRNILPAGGSSALEEDHNLISEPTTANAEQVVRPPHKVNSSGQHRGFRRRCLDFDASVARGKSLDTGKKSLEIRNSGADVSPSCASISPAVLCDRADETSTATTSGFSMSINPLDGKEPLKAESNYSPPAIGAACLRGDGSSGNKSGLLQMSGCCISGSLEPSSVSGGLGAPVCKTQDFRNRAGGNQNVNESNNQGCHPPVMPSGIGLHLNSLTSSLSFKRDCHSSRIGNSEGTWASMLAAEPSKSASPKDDQSSDVHTPLDMGSDGLLLTGCQRFGPGVTSLLKSSQMGKHFPDSSLGSKSLKVDTLDFHSLNHESFAPLRGSLSVVSGDTAARGVSISEQEGMPWQQPDLLHQHEAESPEEFLESPQSLKKRKRKLPVASGEKSGESCKRCNCKKSKCLKLYCECFAAGIYCVSSCACQECFNKPEFEETVLNTRQQIESRNPLAFAPKIVQAAKASPRIGEDTMDTPASARHKRGCNCKKSLCLKKYCECYQAGVGCAEGCRCEGCKNMYGRKEGSREEGKEGDQVFTSQEEPQADDPIELLNRMSGKSEQFRSTGNKNISPITPSFEHDGLGRSMLRLRSGSRKRASDEHCSSTLLQQAGSRPSKSPTWFSNTIDGFQMTANSQGAMELSVDGGTESPLTTMNISRIEHLSPQWEGLADICTLTPLPLAPSRPTPASVTTLDRAGESPHFSTQLIDSTYQGGSSATGHHDGLGRRLRRSPPRFRQPAARSPLHLTQQNTCNENHLIHSRPSSASTHLPVEHSQGGKNSMLAAISASGEDDDTPDFLKCPEVTSPLQTTITKSGSPKQKRVTPPRHCDSREQGPSKSVAGSVPSSSPGLRNGRKFTLQALPSLPPVTPPFSCS